MNKKNNEDWALKRSRIGGYCLPFILIIAGLSPIIKSSHVVNSKIKAQGEIVSISADTTKIRIEGKEQTFHIPSYIFNHIDKSKINKGDFAKILYRDHRKNTDNKDVCCIIEELEINREMLYEYRWWMSFYDAYVVCIWFILVGIILIPFVIRSRNRIVREGGFDPAGPITRALIKVYPEEDENEPTDIDYKEHAVINEDNLVYNSDMNYSVYKTETTEILSVVFSDDKGAYCRYFTLSESDTESGYEELWRLADTIRANPQSFAECEINIEDLQKENK